MAEDEEPEEEEDAVEEEEAEVVDTPVEAGAVEVREGAKGRFIDVVAEELPKTGEIRVLLASKPLVVVEVLIADGANDDSDLLPK
jgi:hypothetical protein